jgi:hypothetical protein
VDVHIIIENIYISIRPGSKIIVDEEIILILNVRNPTAKKEKIREKL